MTAPSPPRPRPTAPDAAVGGRRNVMTVFVGLMLGMLLAAVSQTIISPAMPRIVAELGGIEHYSWIAVSTLLASTVIVPIVGKLSDLFGRKAFYVGGIVTFMAASVIAGVSPNFGTFMVARVVEGFGMGTMMPLSQAIIGDLIAPRERGKYQGMMGAVYGLASIVGPFVGGFITDHFTWRWLFFINIPVGLIALGFIVPFMRLPHAPREHRIDYAGIITLTVGLTTALLATVWGGTQYPWGSPMIVGLYATGAVALAAFVFAERRAAEPVLPLRLWRNGIFATANVANMAVAMGMFGAIYFIPIYAQGVIGRSVTGSGAILTPMMLALVTMSAINGQIISRTGRYKVPVLVGVALIGIGFALLTRMTRATSSAAMVRNMVVVGMGLGMAMQTFTLIVQNAVRREDMGVATAATQLFRSVGSTLGIAILGTMMTNGMAREIPRHLPPEAAAQLSAAGLGAGAAAGGEGASAVLDPAMLARLPAPVREGIRDGLAAAMHPVFVAGLPFIAIAFLASLLIREVPLRRTAPAEATEAGREVLAELVQSGEDDSVPELGADNPLYCERTRLLSSIYGLVAARPAGAVDGELSRILARLGDGDATRGRHRLRLLSDALAREGGADGPNVAPSELLERMLERAPAELRAHVRAVIRGDASDDRAGLTPADMETLERVAVLAAAAVLLEGGAQAAGRRSA
ncbi:MAG TPA: MDR family MFS transporter [Gemmatimonadaceae bacterium]|nr:MDR family MFS transporter [Gemmatimonadaceae bacterium]